MAAETEQFEMHQQLLYDVIRRQAGTLSKAILEGVMNSVDAGATECHVTLGEHECRIVDDGRGFRSREEIRHCFGVFGQPQDPDDVKTYGTFRMGRGQMFAFGHNTWRTGSFEMKVDILRAGLDYALQDELPVEEGCHVYIQLYDPITLSDQLDTRRELEHWLKWAPIPVLLNGEQISRDLASEDWDEVTDEAYVRLRPHGDLAIYNLGVHVLSYGNWKFGSGGEVVSRKQLKVNFARNDIQADCPVWKNVRGLVDQRASEATSKRKSLTDGERTRLAMQMTAGRIPWDPEQKLITAVTGRQYSIDALRQYYEWPAITVAPRGDRRGDVLHRQKVAFVIADETLDRWGVKDVDALLDIFKRLDTPRRGPHAWDKVRTEAYKVVVKGMDANHEILQEKEWRPNERLWQRLIEFGIKYMDSDSDTSCRYRRVQIGYSECSLAWTDGRTYVAFSRQFLEQQAFTIPGISAVGHVLLHELCHHGVDTGDHDHDQEFYEEFHDRAEMAIGQFVDKCLGALPNLCKVLDRRLNKQQAAAIDRERKSHRAVEASPNVTLRAS